MLASRIAPSRQLLALAADEVQRREMFVLLDEQRDAFNYVLHAVERARQSNDKTTVIISGGPGSGKSVIALSLLGELSRQGRTVMHATGSRSFTHTLRKVAGARAPEVKKMFQYFNSFMAAEPNSLDALILDEAHRIRETSVNRWTKAADRSGRPQIDELIAAARVPVFLLDELQVVRPGEQGTVEDIEKSAHRRVRPGRMCLHRPRFRVRLAGVIIGLDLVWRDNGWVMVRSANKDPDFRNRKKVDDSRADRLIRNVYKVLLTRGMRGVAIHSVDHETNDRLRALISNPSTDGTR